MHRTLTGILIAASLLVAAGCSGSDEPQAAAGSTSLAAASPTAAKLDIPGWAARFCAIMETVATESILDDGIDPTTLSLEARIARAVRYTDLQVEVFTTALGELKAVAPPGSVEAYHVAATRQLERFVEVLESSRERLASASAMADIEAENARLNVAATETEADVVSAGEDLPEAAVAALNGVTRCGNVLQ